jgi:ABC-type dipeptide/oligopeptide/nickel transport system permease subunit
VRGVALAIAIPGIALAMALAMMMWTGGELSATDLDLARAAPSLAHWLGCDRLGRDVLIRLLAAAPVTLGIALAAVAVATAAGGAAGMLAGMLGGGVDTVIVLLANAALGVPRLVAVVLLATGLDGGAAPALVIALAFGVWAPLALLARALVQQICREAYVLAAVASGAGRAWVLRVHVLPNAAGPLIVHAAGMLGGVAAAEATLGFLGLGVQEPWPSWGRMMREGLLELSSAPALTVSAATALFVAVAGLNILANRLRGALDPRHSPY